MATILALTALGYVGQALFLKGISETASSIYDTFKDRIFINCPELINFLEEFDLEFKINTIQQFFNEIKITKESDSIKNNLQDIYQVILLFKIEIKKIKKILIQHRTKFLHKWRKPNYKKEMKRLKIYSSLFDKRLSLFKTLVKTFSSDIIEIKDKSKRDQKFDTDYLILNEDEYIIL